MEYAARTAYRVYKKSTKKIMESFDVCWLEENKMDAQVGPGWLFDYESLFKSFNVFSDTVSGSISGLSGIVEEKEEVVVYRPPESPQIDEVAPSTSPSSPSQRICSYTKVAPLSPKEREITSRDISAATQTFMEPLFPEPISNKYVARTSHDHRQTQGGELTVDRFDNIINLPVTVTDISHSIPTRFQCDHLIQNVLGPLESVVQTRSQSGYVNECLYSCFISLV